MTKASTPKPMTNISGTYRSDWIDSTPTNPSKELTLLEHPQRNQPIDDNDKLEI